MNTASSELVAPALMLSLGAGLPAVGAGDTVSSAGRRLPVPSIWWMIRTACAKHSENLPQIVTLQLFAWRQRRLVPSVCAMLDVQCM